MLVYLQAKVLLIASSVRRHLHGGDWLPLFPPRSTGLPPLEVPSPLSRNFQFLILPTKTEIVDLSKSAMICTTSYLTQCLLMSAKRATTPSIARPASSLKQLLPLLKLNHLPAAVLRRTSHSSDQVPSSALLLLSKLNLLPTSRIHQNTKSTSLAEQNNPSPKCIISRPTQAVMDPQTGGCLRAIALQILHEITRRPGPPLELL